MEEWTTYREYLENLSPKRAHIFYLHFVEGWTFTRIAEELDYKDDKSVAYHFREVRKDLGVAEIPQEFIGRFKEVAVTPPPYPPWPPTAYVRSQSRPQIEQPSGLPPRPQPQPQPVPQPHQQEQFHTRNRLIFGLVIAIFVVIALVFITIRVIDMGQGEILGPVAGIPTDTEVPSLTAIPSDTPPPTPTGDNRPTVAAILTLTAEALPTVDELATVVQATTDRLTALAPTSTPTPTATSTPEDTPTSTPTPTDTPTVTPTPTPWTESLFDDFEDGLADFWVVEQGTPEFVNGRLTTPRNLVVTAGDGGWSNYTIEMGTSGFAGRSSEEPLNYIAVAVNEDYKVAFELTGGNVWGHMWIFEDGDWRRVGDRYGGLYSLGGKHLKITVDDGELKALLNGSEIGSYFTTVKTGKVEIKLIADSGIEWIEIIPN